MVLGRIPIKRGQDAIIPVRVLKRERKYCANGAAGGSAKNRNFPKAFVNVVKRTSDLTQRMKRSLRQPTRNVSVDITEAIPFVVSAIYPNRDLATRFEQLYERLERFLAIRCVVQYSYAIDEIKTLRSEWQMKYVSLENGRLFAFTKVPACHFRSGTEIDAYDMAPVPYHYVCESARSTSHVED